MEVESDDDDDADTIQYDDIVDDDLRITHSCKPLSMRFYVLQLLLLLNICTSVMTFLLEVYVSLNITHDAAAVQNNKIGFCEPYYKQNIWLPTKKACVSMCL